MTLIITNNQNTKDMVCKYINIKECAIENIENSFNEYIDKNFMNKKLEHFDKIVIDITDFKDTKEEILKAITRIKVIYDIQIMIIALRYKIGNELLSNLFDIGIYDFIISEDKEKQNEEWIQALNRNNYIDAVKFKINTNAKKKKIKKISKNKLKKNLKENDRQVSKKILACFFTLKSNISYVFSFIWYFFITILVSIGATALLNSNIRQLIVKVIQGGN